MRQKKLNQNIDIENIEVEDKSFLHKNHKGNQVGKFHLKLILYSTELNKMNKIESNKNNYKILSNLHSIQENYTGTDQPYDVASNKQST